MKYSKGIYQGYTVQEVQRMHARAYSNLKKRKARLDRARREQLKEEALIVGIALIPIVFCWLCFIIDPSSYISY